ncbi:MAG: PKD domain-containing protein, partial [Thermoplasmata archaeon]|nr:PKD domain-containing protein [Thermoplasmata archaeon]
PYLSSNGYVYYSNVRDRKFVCVDSENGKKVWEYSGGPMHKVYGSIWDGKLYMGVLETGMLYCFGNLKPIANFSYEPAQVKSGEEIRFYGEGKDKDGKIVNWLWDFGDGNHANGKNVSHVYTRPGKYTVSLTVVDDYGSNNTCVREIIVENRKPIAKFRVSRNVARTYEGIEFYDMSYDVDGAIVGWRWDFGDGEFSQSASVLHEYKDDGEYRVVLRVTDDMGGVNESVAIIRILNREPEATFTYSPDKPTDVEYVEFMGNGSDRDGRIVNWSWDFGDGNIGYGRMVRHRYSDDGVYNVSLMVMDDDGGIGRYWKEVVVSNVGPEVEIEVKGKVIHAGEKVRFYGKGGDIDGRVVEWRWDLGDTTHKNGRNVSHVYSDPGRYVVRLRVVDDDGSVGETSIEIVVEEKKESSSLYLIAIVVVAVIAIAFYFGKKWFLQGKGKSDENSDLPPY